MRRVHLLTVILLVTILGWGCGKKEEDTTAKPADETTTEAVNEGEDAAGEVEETSNEAATAAEKVAKELQPLIDDIVRSIKDGNLDDAEKTLVDLESKKASAPEDIQVQIEEARTAFDTAKAAEEAKSNLPVPIQ